MSTGVRVFRSTLGRVLGWAWVVFAVVNLADILWRGRDASSLVAASVLLLGTGIAYVLGLRPRIVADAEGVRFHNPLRTVWIPWSAVDKIDVTDAVRVHGDGRSYRAWAMQTSPRARARAEYRARRDAGRLPASVTQQAADRTPVDFIVDQLTELAGVNRRTAAAGAPSVRWFWPAVATLVATAAFFAVAVVIAA